jgi:UDPglucose--hexose-1-phosphate uridylyltransferase
MDSPEIRIDQLTGSRVLVTPARSDRPDDFSGRSWKPGDGGGDGDGENCPFCEGAESATPPEVDADRPDGSAPNGPGWITRSFPNLYPALVPEAGMKAEAGAQSAFAASGDPLLASSRGSEPDLFLARPATGHHEVVVNSPGHMASITELDPEGLAVAVEAWRRRMRAHPNAAYVQLILNQGPDSGASLEHSHAQLGAAPFVPAAIARERERFTSYRERTAGASLLEDVLREEIRRGERLVAIDDEVALICPWASRWPYEMRLIPRKASARFEEDDVGSAMLHRALGALVEVFGDNPQLNLWVKTAPRGVEHFHWHLDLAPRLEPASSFEMATGVEVNLVPPEGAASELREAIA